MDLQLNIKNKIAKNLTPDVVIVCGNKDYTIVFTFDEEWAEHDVKTARFAYNGKYEDVVFTGNKCAVPVIFSASSVSVGVFAGDLHTTTPARIFCKRSILCESGTPIEPTPDVYSQIMELINKYVEVGGMTREDLIALIGEGTADLQGKIDDALATSDKSIVGAINEVLGLANDNKNNIDNAVGAANDAKTVAGEAKQAAQGAGELASTANATAAQALETANASSANVSYAVETAQSASDKAENALNTANEAKEIASGVDNTASQALALVQSADTKIQTNAKEIANNKTSIEVLSATTETRFSETNRQVDKNESAIETNKTAIAKNASDIATLSNAKQDNLVFDGNYNAQNNPVATVKTVSDELAQILAGAPTSFDTLKKIADWINAHPESVAELNALIATNTANIAKNTGDIALLNGILQTLQADKQDKTDTGLNTTSKQVVGAINEVKEVADEAKGKIDETNATAVSALTISNEAKNNAQSALDKAEEIETNALPALSQKVDDNKTATDEAIAQARTDLVDYTDAEIEAAIKEANAYTDALENTHNADMVSIYGDMESKDNDTLINANTYTDTKVGETATAINSRVEEAETQIFNLGEELSYTKDEIKGVESIAKGANRAVAYDDYKSMLSYLEADPSDMLSFNVGQNIYIRDTNVPDLWVSEHSTYHYPESVEAFLEELRTNNLAYVGYYGLSPLETQKADITNLATKDEVETAKNEAISASQVKIVRLI